MGKALSSSSHVEGGREGVAGMQTRAAGTGMSVGQQGHTRTHTHGMYTLLSGQWLRRRGQHQ